MHQIIANIKLIRDIKNLSQEELADGLAITQSAYARFEKGGKKIDYKIIEGIAKLFEMDIEELIYFHKREYSKRGITKDVIKEGKEQYKVQKDTRLLLAKIKHLEKVNDMLTKQIEDKDKIIDLLSTKKRK